MYAIIDIETTGGSPVNEKITEIAVFIHNGQQIVDEYTTLINPEKKIPYNITSLTGITNDMVADAPKFYEVARKIVEITEDKVFVAHNVSFDYNFIRQEFKRLGYQYEREKLCTVKLSRKLIPGLASYSLGRLCDALGIQVTGRHRAAGDALATASLFSMLHTINKNSGSGLLELPGISKKDLHPSLDIEKVKKLPEETGVYYFYDENQQLVYVGKSKNIRSRVFSHLGNYTTKKGMEMMQKIVDIDYELTGSELIALLKESDEIKKNKPIYNRQQRRNMFLYGLYRYTDNAGYIRFAIEKNNKKTELPLTTFSSYREALNYLGKLIDEYRLCQKLCGLYTSHSACFHYEIMECDGACIGKELPESYNLRAQQVVYLHSYEHDNFFIIDTGNYDDEISVVKIEKGMYIGFGYMQQDALSENPQLLHDCIKPFRDNRDTHQIIRSYLRKNRVKMILPFD